jgi:hypothetical protein
LLAGWEVAGAIRDGTFFSSVVPRTRDAGRWLDSALDTPLGRRALLARDIDEIALGPALFSGPDAIGSVVCGYRLHHGNDHSADVAALNRRIAAVRASAGLAAPSRLSGVGAVIARELAHVQDGTRGPVDALRVSLADAAERTRGGARMKGYVLETTSLDAIDLPKDLLKQRWLHLEIGVTHYKPPGAAWAQLVVLFVFEEIATTET